MTIKIGFIGAGDIALIHAQCLTTLKPKISIEAAYDINQRNAQVFAKQTGARLCDSVDGLLKRDIDVVYICTRHDSHFEFVSKAVQAGKAIFCEKPLALDFQQAEALHKLVTESGLPFAIGYNHRCAPGVEEIRKRLGDTRPNVMHISMVTAPFLHTWAGLPEVGGGILHCLGSHALDLIRYIMQDEPIEIGVFSSRQRLPETHLDDTAVGILRFPDHRLVSVNFHDQGSHEYSVDPGGALMRVEIFAGGKLVVGHTLNDILFQVDSELSRYQVPEREQITSWGYMNINRRFVAYLEGDDLEEAPPLIEDGFQAARLVNAAWRSVESGQIIKL